MVVLVEKELIQVVLVEKELIQALSLHELKK